MKRRRNAELSRDGASIVCFPRMLRVAIVVVAGLTCAQGLLSRPLALPHSANEYVASVCSSRPRSDASLRSRVCRRDGDSALRMASSSAPLNGVGIIVHGRKSTLDKKDDAAELRWQNSADQDAQTYQVTVAKPLGIELMEVDDIGVVVKSVWRGSNAEAVGIQQGDVITATCSTVGGRMWEKKSVDGVVSALTSRFLFSDEATIQLRRAIGLWAITADDEKVNEEVEVPLSRPMGLILGQDRNGVFVKGLRKGGSADRTGIVKEGDKVMAVSNSVGRDLEPVLSVDGLTKYCQAKARDVVVLRLQRKVSLNAANFSRELAPTVYSMIPEAEKKSSPPSDTVDTAAEARKPLSKAKKQSIAAHKIMSRFGETGTADGFDQVWKAIVESSIKLQQQGNEASKDGKEQPPSPSLRVRHTAMRTAIKLGAPEKAVQLFNDIKRDGLTPDEKTYTVLIKALGRGGSEHLDDAFEALDEMKASGAQPHNTIYNTLLSACTRSGDLKRAELLFWGKMDARRGKEGRCDVTSWNVLMNGYARAGQAEKAVQLMEEMPATGVMPDRITYTTLMKALIGARRVDDAAQVLQAMVSASEAERIRDQGLEPDTQAYNTLIDGYCRRLSWRKALETLAAMKSRGVKPDIFTYALLMDGTIKAKVPARALALFSAVKRDGIVPNLHCYTMAVSALAKLGDPLQAISVMQEMQTAGVRPNKRTFTSAMEACVRGGRGDLAVELAQEMKRAGLKMDDVATCVLIRAWGALGEMSKAEDLLLDMRASGHAPPVVAYNALIQAAVDRGEFKEAIRFVDQLLAVGYSPSEATALALAGPSLDGSTASSPQARVEMLLEAAQAFRQKLGRGVHGAIYVGLLSDYIKMEDLATANQLVKERDDGAFVVGKKFKGQAELLEDKLRRGPEANELIERGLPGSLQELMLKRSQSPSTSAHYQREPEIEF
ncbi:unnamed protein product [Chrysoparadoxa australica]